MQDRGHRADALTREAVAWGPPPHMHGGRSHDADRVVSRKLLMSGSEDHISFGKRFESYVVGNSGDVEVRFADGSMERGTVLFGADGVRSGVRRLLLPNYTVLDTEGRAVFGKTAITPDLVVHIPQELEQGITVAGETQEDRIRLFCDIIKFNRVLNAGQKGDSPAFDLPADYFLTVLVFRRDILGRRHPRDTLLSLNNTESAQGACKLTDYWHLSSRAILESQD